MQETDGGESDSEHYDEPFLGALPTYPLRNHSGTSSSNSDLGHAMTSGYNSGEVYSNISSSGCPPFVSVEHGEDNESRCRTPWGVALTTEGSPEIHSHGAHNSFDNNKIQPCLDAGGEPNKITKVTFFPDMMTPLQQCSFQLTDSSGSDSGYADGVTAVFCD